MIYLDSLQTCVIDILRHVPRCAFSDSQHTAIQWCLAALGVSDVPSPRVAKDIDKALQASCGIDTKRYNGALGHIYYVNDLGGILAQVCMMLLLRVCRDDGITMPL